MSEDYKNCVRHELNKIDGLTMHVPREWTKPVTGPSDEPVMEINIPYDKAIRFIQSLPVGVETSSIIKGWIAFIDELGLDLSITVRNCGVSE